MDNRPIPAPDAAGEVGQSSIFVRKVDSDKPWSKITPVLRTLLPTIAKVWCIRYVRVGGNRDVLRGLHHLVTLL